jgi:hypothetical protein
MSRFLWKIGLLGLSDRKCKFRVQNPDQALWKHVLIFVFCARFDPTNYRYCGIGLQTKYTPIIEQGIFLRMFSIHDGEQRCMNPY